MIVHLVARARQGMAPLADPALAWHLWVRLRRRWPVAFAACLMPNHVHLIARVRRAEGEAAALGQVLAGASRTGRLGAVWEPVPAPRAVPDTSQLRRQVRYVLLNPCRAKLVTDPLGWPWSTHRGVVGAELDPWVTAAQLARQLELPETGFAEWFHRYVSSDPAVNVKGTPFPAPAGSRDVAEVPLAWIEQAAHSATPLADPCLRRRLVVLLAWHQGWRDAHVLSGALGVHPSTVRRLARRRHSALLAIGTLHLGDERLRTAVRCVNRGRIALG